MNASEICKQIIEAPRETAIPDRDGLALFLKESADIFMKEKNLLKLSGKAIFVGDLHGDLDSASSAFGLASEKKANVVFLGDIVDRGSSQLETINLILARKMLEPDKVHVLRGNHEFKEVNTRYGFADEVMKRYDQTIYWLYNVCFSTLPLTALLNERVFAIHGGVCERIRTLADIEKLERSSMDYRDERLEMLWNDPSETEPGLTFNASRGGFHRFGRDVFEEFMNRNKLELIVRAHEPWPDGYKYFFGKRLISVFSCADCYDIKPKAAMVDEDCQIEILGL